MVAPELWLSVIAIIVSVASVAFVILEVGIKLGLGYREDETTSTRKIKIEKALSDESSGELTSIAELIVSKKTSDKELKDKILNLARIEYYSDFAKNLLDKMSTYVNAFLKGICVLYSLFL